MDEAVVRRLIRHVGAEPGPIYGKNGKAHLRRQVNGYNAAARWAPWIVLVDLNHDADCAPLLRDEWLPSPASQMCFRVAVRVVEAWLLADHQQIARFLGVSAKQIPPNPEEVADPKGLMVELARRSRRRDIREDMVPRPGSGRRVGPAYTARLIEFVEDTKTGWRPDVAATSANSLRRCIECLRRLIRRLHEEATHENRQGIAIHSEG